MTYRGGPISTGWSALLARQHPSSPVHDHLDSLLACSHLLPRRNGHAWMRYPDVHPTCCHYVETWTTNCALLSQFSSIIQLNQMLTASAHTLRFSLVSTSPSLRTLNRSLLTLWLNLSPSLHAVVDLLFFHKNSVVG
jgi:hypothetical protein